MTPRTRAERIRHVKLLINRAIKKWHPDRNPDPSAPEKTRKLIELKKYVERRYG